MAREPHISVTASPAERASLAKSRNRYRLACLAFALSFLAIAVRLVTLGFAAVEPGYGGIHDISTTVHRPDILDRNGRLLATDIKGATLYADPAKVIDRDELVEQVASVLPDINTAELREKLKNGKRFVAIKRELTPKQQAEIYELGQAGLGFIEEYRRVYPMGATASHVVGHVNVDNKGLAGIEKFIDDNPQLAMSAPENAVGGEAVTLSLDLGVQHVLREELVNAMTTYRAKAAAGVVIDVESGEVVAMVSLPDYDPNYREQALDKDRLNRMTSGVYELGSVFKVFTLAAALDGGSATMRSSYDASQPIRVGRFTIEDFHGKKRRLTVPEIFIYSSNIGAAKAALDLGIERHKAFLGKIGLLGRLSTEIGETAEPLIPSPWGRLNTITIAYGHGLSVTPLQLATATASSGQRRVRREPDLPAAHACGGAQAEPKRAQASHQPFHAPAHAPQRAEGHRQARRGGRLSRRRQDRHGGEGGRPELRRLGSAQLIPRDLPHRRSGICRAGDAG